MFKLARDLGCTVHELLHVKRISQLELTWWIAFYGTEAQAAAQE